MAYPVSLKTLVDWEIIKFIIMIIFKILKTIAYTVCSIIAVGFLMLLILIVGSIVSNITGLGILLSLIIGLAIVLCMLFVVIDLDS